MKKLILGIFILLITISAVFAADGVTVPNSVTNVVRGASTQGTVTVRNTGTTNLTSIAFVTTQLVSTSNPANSLPGPIMNPLNLNVGQSQNFNFDVVTTQATPAETYVGSVITLYNATGSITSTVTVNVQGPTYGIQDITTVTAPESYPGNQVTATFTVRNTGNSPITNVHFTGNADPKYGLVFTPATIASIGGGQSSNVNVRITIPAGEVTGTRNIASVNIIADQAQDTFVLQEKIGSKLKITEVNAIVDGNSDDEIAYGDTIGEDAIPQSKVTFEVTVENTFTDSEDIKIKNIEVTATILEIDDGDDIDATSQTFTLSSDSDKQVNIELYVPLEVEEDNFKVLIEANGKDENRADQEAKYEVYLSVDKKSHQVRILNAELLPTSVLCGEEVRIPVELINLGTNQEDKVKVSMISADLKINEVESNIELGDNPFDTDSKYKKTYSFTIPRETAEKTYPIDIKTYYNDNVYADQKRLVLDVKCAKPTTTTTSTTTSTTLPTNTTIIDGDEWNDNNSTDYDLDPEQSDIIGNIVNLFSGENKFKALLIVLDVLVMIAVILGIIVYMRRKKD